MFNLRDLKPLIKPVKHLLIAGQRSRLHHTFHDVGVDRIALHQRAELIVEKIKGRLRTI